MAIILYVSTVKALLATQLHIANALINFTNQQTVDSPIKQKAGQDGGLIRFSYKVFTQPSSANIMCLDYLLILYRKIDASNMLSFTTQNNIKFTATHMQ